MKYKKIEIETNGTTAETKISIDGKQIGLIQRIEFSADVNESFVKLGVHVARTINGVVKTRKTKVRDNKTEMFVEKDEVQTELLNLEREVWFSKDIEW